MRFGLAIGAVLVTLGGFARPAGATGSPFDRPSGTAPYVGTARGDVLAEITAGDPPQLLADEAWWDGFGRAGTSYTVRALAVYRGALVAAGYFSAAGGGRADHLAAWDGSAWRPLAEGTDLHVNALAVYRGCLIAGGRFTRAGRTSASCIGRWDGATWHPLGAGLGHENPRIKEVHALAVHRDLLIVGGEFETAGGSPASNIAAWDGTRWWSLGIGTDLPVQALAVHGGDLIAGGRFSEAGGSGAMRVARWDGWTWHAMGSGIEQGSTHITVQSLAVHRGQIYAGTRVFRTDGAYPAFQRWDGAGWEPVGSGVSSAGNPMIEAMTEFQGDLVVAGHFEAVGDQAAYNVARWNGTSWTPSRLDLVDAWARVFALTVYRGELIAGGAFARAGEVTTNCVARWDGTAWRPLGPPGAGMDGPVRAMAGFRGDLVAGGDFGRAGDVRADFVARWDGTAWHPLGAGLDAPVAALAVYGGALVALGEFARAGDVVVNHVARWDGVAWSALGTGLDQGSSRFGALEVHDGALFVGGWFERAGDVAAASIARWDGTAWSALGAGVNGPVYDLLSFGGALVAAGEFQEAGGNTVSGIARWDGATWSGVGGGVYGAQDLAVRALTVHEGVLVAGGEFTEAGGVAAWNLARWNGTAWSAFGSGIGGGLDATGVWALASYNGRLVAAGEFPTDAGARRNIAQWDGATWDDLGSGVSIVTIFPFRFFPVVRTLCVHEGSLYVGGQFTVAGNKHSAWIARWDGPVVPSGVEAFDVRSENGVATLAWRLAPGVADTLGALRVERSAAWRGPFATVATLPAAAAGADSFADTSVETGQVLWYQLVLQGSAGSETLTGPVGVTITGRARWTTSLATPFEPAGGAPLRIRFVVGSASPSARLELFDVRGRRVRTVASASFPPDEHFVTWDRTDDGGRRVARGVYFLHLRTAEATATRRFAFLGL